MDSVSPSPGGARSATTTPAATSDRTRSLTQPQARVGRKLLPATSALLLATGLLGCASSPPKNPENACAIFEEKPRWYKDARKAERKWGTPVQIQLAILRLESSFRSDAKPRRAELLGLPLWWRISSAYGYPQAKDGTWDWYKDKTGNRRADRDDFGDACDFIGWYTDVSQRTLGISKWDGYNQYLAYHEGHGGWQRGTYRSKPWLIERARVADRYARTYGEQLRSCRDRLD